MYGIFALGYKRNLNGSGNHYIPSQLLGSDAIIYYHQSKEVYTQYDVKDDLCENMFDLDKVEKKRHLNYQSLSHAPAKCNSDKQSRLTFSVPPDEHMASMPFEKIKTDWAPMNKDNVNLQK
ncbi:uncharacterized protein EV154DRAFT_568867 [Mucor mucedo]|uniref:uncharacterized protein n=1 Tax=Mucor mucedo TaxID=29922 RepID=UPI00221EA36E|nr:uncharacterized protein EV154DRAFT_568867 [Mucor mucedo]KAI7878537.1 hypothetical protein EV154DRAFT_568867 [Mucor mucedo]